MTLSFHDFGDYSVFEREGHYEITWWRGKDMLLFPISRELFELAQRSKDDALEVMFYAEHGRWAVGDELATFNQTDIITHTGQDFFILEDHGHFEMHWQASRPYFHEAVYPITKTQKEQALVNPAYAHKLMEELEKNGNLKTRY